MRTVAIALFALLGGCTSADAPVVVFAASSLTDVLTALEPTLEKRLSADVAFNFAGSQALRLQIEQGAPADVFVTADVEHLSALVDAGLAASGRRFATNELVVAVPKENPAGVRRFEDLARADRIVVGAPDVPIGGYTKSVLSQTPAPLSSAIERGIVSKENNARLVLAKVALGEADAAIVYRTDALASDRVTIVELPDALQTTAHYEVAPLERSKSGATVVEILTGPAGQAALDQHGFGRP